MDILFGEISKTYKYHLSNDSTITITQTGNDIVIHIAENCIIKFNRFLDEVSLAIAENSAPYYASRSKERAIKLIDDVITRVHGCNPVHNIVVNLLDEIMKPDPEIIPIV